MININTSNLMNKTITLKNNCILKFISNDIIVSLFAFFNIAILIFNILIFGYSIYLGCEIMATFWNNSISEYFNLSQISIKEILVVFITIISIRWTFFKRPDFYSPKELELSVSDVLITTLNNVLLILFNLLVLTIINHI